ncbi:MAG: hypothetical protein U5L08_07575 [Xanthomonadales bacterium]|nr:hypothetical protein [Xanthomonadales bacterium]
MHKSFPQLRPKALADFLWYRYEIQPGQALCVALGQPDANDNYEALVAWTREAIDHRTAEVGLVDSVTQIEGDLIERLYDAGLASDVVEARPVPDRLVHRLFEPAMALSARADRNPLPAAKSHARQSKVIDLAGRSRHD